MKKKYLNKVKLKNSDDLFKCNVKLYCSLIAKKVGKSTKYVQEYFDKYFKFLDEIGVLDYIPKNRINKNIKTLAINWLKKIDGNTGAYYLISDNSINFRKSQSLNDVVYFIHEFNHMLSADIEIVRNKNEVIENEISGFSTFKSIIQKPNVSSTLKTLNLLELCKYVESFKVVSLDNYYKAEDWGRPFLNEYVTYLIYESCTSMDNYCKEKILDELVVFFTKKDFKEMNIALSPSVIAQITKINDNKYTVKEYTNLNAYTTDGSFDITGINEGTTQFLTCMFLTKFFGKDNLNYIYITEVKCVEMLYKLFGNSLFEGYFSHSFKPMEEYLGLEEGELKQTIERIERLNKNQYLYYDISNGDLLNLSANLTYLLGEKIAGFVIYFPNQIESAENIYNMIYSSIYEYSKSLYFGINKNQVCTEVKDAIKNDLAQVFNLTIDLIKDFANEDNNQDERFMKIVDSLEKLTPEDEAQVVKNIELINNNLYNFIEYGLEEIVPISYVDGVNMYLRDSNKQDYIRTSIKAKSGKHYFKIKDFNNYEADVYITEKENQNRQNEQNSIKI